MTFDPTAYGTAVSALLGDGGRLAALGPGNPDPAVRPLLAAFAPHDLGPIRDSEAARACHSALWLYHDFLDESHAISQDLQSATGSFWHAVMHRREPDAWNSKYWWRKVGKHPVLTHLATDAPGLGYSYSTPEDFVDFCERVRGTGSPGEDLAKRVQLLEWQLLFDHCFHLAVGADLS